MTWRLAHSLEILRAEVDLRWPARSKISDGTIGDAAHASRDSDHNPWVIDAGGIGVVRAIDITMDGIEGDVVVEHLRLLGEGGDRRLDDGGYVISKSRIASATSGWQWRTYTGSNPHDHHFHLSVSRTPDGYDSDRSWGIVNAAPEDDMTDAERAQLAQTLTLATAAARDAAKALEVVEEIKDLVVPLLKTKADIPYARLKYITQRPGDTDAIAVKVLAGLKDGKVTTTQIEAAFRNVLGKLDED